MVTTLIKHLGSHLNFFVTSIILTDSHLNIFDVTKNWNRNLCMRSQEITRGPRRYQEVPGGTRRYQEVPLSPKQGHKRGHKKGHKRGHKHGQKQGPRRGHKLCGDLRRDLPGDLPGDFRGGPVDRTCGGTCLGTCMGTCMGIWVGIWVEISVRICIGICIGGPRRLQEVIRGPTASSRRFKVLWGIWGKSSSTYCTTSGHVLINFLVTSLNIHEYYLEPYLEADLSIANFMNNLT